MSTVDFKGKLTLANRSMFRRKSQGEKKFASCSCGTARPMIGSGVPLAAPDLSRPTALKMLFMKN
jgi:hypothetical protein